MRASSLLDQHGRWTLAGLLQARREVGLQAVLVRDEALQVRIVRVRRRREVQQVERSARRRSEVGSDRRDNAARGTGDYEDAASVEWLVGRRTERCLGETDGPAQPVVRITDFHAAGVAQGLVDEEARNGGRVAPPGHVDNLDEGVGLLAPVGLREAAHRPTERSGSSRLVVAVVAAEAGRRDKERLAVIEAAHRDIEVLDATHQGVMPCRRIHRLDRALVVESGQPVDAAHRPVRKPAVKCAGELLGIHAGVEDETRATSLGQALDQVCTHSALVEHHDDTMVAVERDAGLLAQIQARPQDSHRNAPRVAVGSSPIAAHFRAGQLARGPSRRRRLNRPFDGGYLVRDPADDVIQRRELAQLQVLVTLHPEPLPHRREHLSLLDRIHPQIGLQIQIEIQQLRRIPRHLRHDRHHGLNHRHQRQRLPPAPGRPAAPLAPVRPAPPPRPGTTDSPVLSFTQPTT